MHVACQWVILRQNDAVFAPENLAFEWSGRGYWSGENKKRREPDGPRLPLAWARGSKPRTILSDVDFRSVYYWISRVRFARRPTKSRLWLLLSRITKIKGLSALNLTGSMGIDLVRMVMAVAAAASVPLSSTETNALWMTSLMLRLSASVMPEKSAPLVNASTMPIACNVLFRVIGTVNSNFGSVRLTVFRSRAATVFLRVSAFKVFSNFSRSSGKSTSIDTSPPS